MNDEMRRTIHFTSHASKILCRIIKIRLESKIDSNLGNDQSGFRKDKGTREAILSLRILIEKQIRVNKDVLIAFVDLEKAFDNVNWDKMFNILKRLEITYNDRRVIYNLYKNQVIQIQLDGIEEVARIGKGVRQGYILSHILFNMYIEEAIKEIKNEIQVGVRIGGQKVVALRF